MAWRDYFFGKAETPKDLPNDPTEDELDAYMRTKGFSLRDFSSYMGDIISGASGAGGWDGIYQFQPDYFRRATDTLFGGGDTYDGLSSLTMGNPFGSACMKLIINSISDIEWEMAKTMSGKKMVSDNHPLLRLMEEPGLWDVKSSKRTPKSIFAPIIQHLFFAGEVFFVLGNKKEPELQMAEYGRTDFIFEPAYPLTFTIIHPKFFSRFIRDTNNNIIGYEFDIVRGGKQTKVQYSINQVVHMKCYNNKNEERGFPMIMGAKQSLIQARMSALWNTNLSRTGGRVQGYFSPKGLKPGQELSPETVANIENYLDKKLKERQDRNLPMVMSGAMEYLANTVSPREADFLENDKLNQRKITTDFGIPTILVGDVDSQGLGGGSALENAKELMWINCLIPIVRDFLKEINLNIAPRFAGGYEMTFDPKKIEALARIMEKKYKGVHMAVGGAWLTPNEGRKETGWGTRNDQPEFDKLRKGKGTGERDDKRSDYERDNDAENVNNRG